MIPGAVLIGALAASGVKAGLQVPVFPSGVESVYVDAFVTRGGHPVLGLDASHFELKDNGVLQRPELVSVESLRLTALLVLDISDSVRGPKLVALRAAAEAFLAGLRPGDQVGLLSFSEEVRWLSRPTPDKGAVSRTLGGLRAEGATALWDALSAALTVLPTTSRSLVVLFSDGEDNLSWLDGVQVRAQAERSNVLIQVVGLSVATSEPAYISELRQVAQVTGGRLWSANSPARLANVFAAIIEAMKTRYVLRYDPGPEVKRGWHRIDLRLKGAKGDVRTRRGYWRGR